MEHTQEICMRNGQKLISLTGYSGEEDFYFIYKIIQELLQPEHITYGVDSMCVDGSFQKDGLLIRMSSECITDQCCFHYDPTAMTEADVEKVKGWITNIVQRLHQEKPL